MDSVLKILSIVRFKLCCYRVSKGKGRWVAAWKKEVLTGEGEARENEEIYSLQNALAKNYIWLLEVINCL